MKRRCLLAIALVALLGAPTTGVAQDNDAKRSLTQVTDSVWRFDNNFHVSFAVVTENGIVVGDPINAAAAEWLKEEIESRFDQPITHMIYSHHHGDHTSGVQVLAETARVYAHSSFEELAVAAGTDTAMPTDTFEKTLELTVGEKTFEMTHLGFGGHSDDLIATVIRPDNVAFVVDVVSPRRLPWQQINTGSLEGLDGQIAAVEALDFDILLPGHSVNGTRADASEARQYLADLKAYVDAELAAGKSAEEIQAGAAEAMADYSEWGMFGNMLAANVSGMIRLASQ